jgi:hypothetical protein
MTSILTTAAVLLLSAGEANAYYCNSYNNGGYYGNCNRGGFRGGGIAGVIVGAYSVCHTVYKKLTYTCSCCVPHLLLCSLHIPPSPA